MLSDNTTFPSDITPLLAEEIGLHVGDGSMNYYNGKGFYQLRGHIVDDKEHYVQRVKPLYKEIFNIDVSLRHMPSTGVFGFQIWSNKLVYYKHNVLGLPTGKKTKFLIPDQIVCDDKLAKCFLRGLFDTDGCIYVENKRGKPYPRIEITTVSKNLIEQLKIMLTRLEYRWSCHTWQRKNKKWKDPYRIVIRGEKMTQKWFSEIGSHNPKHVIKFLSLKMGPGGFEPPTT